MNECELVKKILNHMNAEDYKILINKVWFRGFWVPGIANQRSDKKWRPKVEFINNDVVLNRKIRKGGKHNYELLIEGEKNEKIIQSQWFFRHDKNASTQCGCI